MFFGEDFSDVAFAKGSKKVRDELPHPRVILDVYRIAEPCEAGDRGRKSQKN
jgi:hypothetical protein